MFFIRKLNKDESENESPYELSVYYKSNIYHKKIYKSTYEEYSLDSSEMVAIILSPIFFISHFFISFLKKKCFESVADMIRYYNYEKLELTRELSIKLKIYSKYILLKEN